MRNRNRQRAGKVGRGWACYGCLAGVLMAGTAAEGGQLAASDDSISFKNVFAEGEPVYAWGQVEADSAAFGPPKFLGDIYVMPHRPVVPLFSFLSDYTGGAERIDTGIGGAFLPELVWDHAKVGIWDMILDDDINHIFTVHLLGDYVLSLFGGGAEFVVTPPSGPGDSQQNPIVGAAQDSLVKLMELRDKLEEAGEDPIGFIKEEIKEFLGVSSGRWFDPPLAEGYAYAMTGGSKFTQIWSFPAGIDADNIFRVSADGMDLGLFGSGVGLPIVDFTAFKPGGVTAFKVTEINPAIDVQTGAFPLFLSFDTGTASFLTAPILVPEPGSAVALGLGLAGVMIRRRLN